jgi:hypothetical protein
VGLVMVSLALRDDNWNPRTWREERKARLARFAAAAVVDKGIDLKRKPEPAEPIVTVSVAIAEMPAPRVLLIEQFEQYKIIRKYPLISSIQRAVRACYNIKVMDFVSARRPQYLVRPRQIAMYLCKTLTPNSYPEIGRRFRRDHSTVIHAVDVITRRLADPDPKHDALRADVALLTQQLTPPVTKETTDEHREQLTSADQVSCGTD